MCMQDKNAVFTGTFGALAIMTVISVALGRVRGTALRVEESF